MNWRNKTITVFGGTGFIGRHVVQRLARLGARIVVPTREMDGVLALKPNGEVGQIIGLRGSLSDQSFLETATRGSDAIINLIGILQENRKNAFMRVHAEFPGALAKLAAGRPLVHLSALGADEKSASAYARSKAAGEKAVLAAQPSATILRPSIVIGPEDNFFNRFARMSLLAPALPLIGGGHTRFQPVYVGDVADAIVAALNFDGARGMIFELGGPAVFSFKELLEMLAKETGRRRPLVKLPFWMANIQAGFLQLLPNAPLTQDQVKLLKQDNVVRSHAAGLRDLGIMPTAIETILPEYLDRYRAGGMFAA